MVDWFKTSPNDSNVFNFESYGGKIARPTTEHSFVHREHLATFVCNSYYDSEVEGDFERAKTWCYEFVINDSAGLFVKASYQNYQ